MFGPKALNWVALPLTLAAIACAAPPAGGSEEEPGLFDASLGHDAAPVDPDAEAGPPDAGIACDPSLPESASGPGSYWLAFVTKRDSQGEDELWAAKVQAGVAQAPIRLNGPLPDRAGVLVSVDEARPSFRWSSDGSKLVYIADEEIRRQYELFMVDMSGDTPAQSVKVSSQLVADGDVASYRLSPDGRKLAYIAEANFAGVFELFVVDLEGSSFAAQRVNSLFVEAGMGVYDFKWSADSTHLAFFSNGFQAAREDIFVSDVSGPSPTPAVRVTESSETNREFTWSPTELALAYSTKEDGRKLYLADISAGAVLARTAAPVTNGTGQDAKWNASGDSLSFRGPGSYFIWNVDQGTASAVTGNLLEDNSMFEVAPNESKVGFESFERLYSGPADGSTPPIKESTTHLVIDMRWLFDSSAMLYIAVVGPPERSEMGLYTSTPAHLPVRLTDVTSIGNAGNQPPRFFISPDSGRVAYLSNHARIDFNELYLADIDCLSTPNLRINDIIQPDELVAEKGVTDASWSPDGTLMSYQAHQRNDDYQDLYIVDLSTHPPSGSTRIDIDLPDSVGVRVHQWSPVPLQ